MKNMRKGDQNSAQCRLLATLLHLTAMMVKVVSFFFVGAVYIGILWWFAIPSTRTSCKILVECSFHRFNCSSAWMRILSLMSLLGPVKELRLPASSFVKLYTIAKSASVSLTSAIIEFLPLRRKLLCPSRHFPQNRSSHPLGGDQRNSQVFTFIDPFSPFHCQPGLVTFFWTTSSAP